MIFPPVAHYVYTEEDVGIFASNQEGIYGLLKNEIFVYIGRGKIKDRLLAHLNGDNPCITRQSPTHFAFFFPPPFQIDQTEKELIVQFDPPCNKRAG